MRFIHASRSGAAARALFLLLAGACTRIIELGGEPGDLGRDAAPDGASSDGVGADGAGGGACERRGLLEHDVVWNIVLILLERSQSMLEPLDGEPRIARAQRAILAAGVLSLTSVGLIEFPGPRGACSAGANCCTAALRLPPSPWREGTVDFRGTLSCSYPGEPETCPIPPDAAPTAEALALASGFLDNVRGAHIVRHVLLLTDGDPTCAATGDPCTAAVARATALRLQTDAHLSVIGIGAQTQEAACLSAIAAAGRRPGNPAANLFVARSAAALDTAVVETLRGIDGPDCVLAVRGGVGDPATLQVWVDGRRVPPASAANVEGWRVSSTQPAHLLIAGPACDALRASRSSDVRVYRCCSDGPSCPDPGGRFSGAATSSSDHRP